MLQKIADNLTSYFVSKGFLDENKYDWYVYTIQRRISSVTGSIILLTAGTILLGFIETIIFLLSILFIRKRSSGYHATSLFRCWLLSLLILVFNALIVYYFPSYFSLLPVLLIVILLSNIIIFKYAPINHPNMKQTEISLLANKAKVRKIIIVESIIVLLFHFIFPGEKYSICCVLGMLTAALSVILAKIKKQEVIHE